MAPERLRCTGRDRCGWPGPRKTVLGGLRSSCLGILWALGLPVEILEFGVSSSEAFCVGFKPLPGPSLPRQLGLELQRTQLVLESYILHLDTRGHPLTSSLGNKKGEKSHRFLERTYQPALCLPAETTSCVQKCRRWGHWILLVHYPPSPCTSQLPWMESPFLGLASNLRWPCLNS